MPRARRSFALLSALLMTLSVLAPAAATDRKISTSTDTDLDAPAPAGVAACDLRLSTLDGPLVDDNFSIRAYEDFAVWGFDYPASSDITIGFRQGSSTYEPYATTTDADGVFAEAFMFFPGVPASWTIEASPNPANGCFDSANITVLPPHPFTDVIDHAFELEISWLFHQEITGGCTSTKFCPANGVTRGQMAAFLTRALNLPSTTVDYFDDDDGTLFENDINRLANADITGGCATRRFCQNAFVTREQMASFLTRALELRATSTDFFSDDESSAHENDINSLAAADITGGCTATSFCPRAQVTRGQMAAFLYRALYQ